MQGVRLAVVALMIGIAATATAEDKVAARQAYLEGSKYYDLNQYAEALEAFKRAYWNYEEPTFLYNIAQCHRALKHKSEAIDFYRSYLRKSPDAPNRAEVQRIIGDLEAAIAHEKAVTTAPPQGTITESKPPTKSTPAPAPTTIAPSQPATTAPAVVTTTSEPPPVKSEKPTWKKPWVWGVVAGAVVVVAGVAIGVGLATSQPKDPSPSFGSIKVSN